MNKEIIEITSGFKRVLSLMERPEKSLLLIASLVMIIVGALTNLPALILGKLIDRIIKLDQFEFSEVLPFILVIIFIIILREALTVFRKYLVENIATQIEKKQTINVIERLLKTDIASINSQQIGSLHGKVFRSIQGLVRLIKLGFLDFLPVFFSAISAIIIVFTQKPLIASIMILVIPIGIFLILKQVSSQKGIRVSLLRGKEKIDGAVVEMLGGLETVRVLNTTEEEVNKIDVIAEELRKKEIKHHIYMALFDAAKQLNEGFFYILVVSLAILFSAQGIISKGDILVYSILFLSITQPLREIHRILDQAHESSILVSDLHELLNYPKDKSYLEKENANVNLMSKNPNKIIEINNLSFSYPEREGKVLKNINIDIFHGEKIGIVSSSGGGKSTLIKILLRLLHNYSGDVYILGKNLNEVSRDEIAEKIAYIPQKTYIFSGTIKDNITYGCRRDVDEEELINASKKANIYQEILNDLGGFNGKVTENGNNLSGGQRQRLAIARLILKSPDVFIFDEATSALDNSNEVIIQKNIEQLFQKKTMITIAHRLTTLKNCDRILVFEKGEIIQRGSFTELSAKKGLFQDFLRQREVAK